MIERPYKATNAFTVLINLLRDRKAFTEEIIHGIKLDEKILAMLVASSIFFAIYGAIIGASHSLPQAASSAVKLPILYLLTLVICFPSLYIFNVFLGSIQTFKQQFALILTAVGVISVLLFGFAPITLFFLMTAKNYQFFKLLNVAIFALTGFIGVNFFYQSMRAMAAENEMNQESRTHVLQGWLILYAFVGSQLGWTLRPFFGSPETPFVLFREMEGNFYLNIVDAIAEILGFQ